MRSLHLVSLLHSELLDTVEFNGEFLKSLGSMETFNPYELTSNDEFNKYGTYNIHNFLVKADRVFNACELQCQVNSRNKALLNYIEIYYTALGKMFEYYNNSSKIPYGMKTAKLPTEEDVAKLFRKMSKVCDATVELACKLRDLHCEVKYETYEERAAVRKEISAIEDEVDTLITEIIKSLTTRYEEMKMRNEEAKKEDLQDKLNKAAQDYITENFNKEQIENSIKDALKDCNFKTIKVGLDIKLDVEVSK